MFQSENVHGFMVVMDRVNSVDELSYATAEMYPSDPITPRILFLVAPAVPELPDTSNKIQSPLDVALLSKYVFASISTASFLNGVALLMLKGMLPMLVTGTLRISADLEADAVVVGI